VDPSGKYKGVNPALKTLSQLGFVEGIMRQLDTDKQVSTVHFPYVCVQSGISGGTDEINKRVAK
jgi:hypothetical protein